MMHAKSLAEFSNISGKKSVSASESILLGRPYFEKIFYTFLLGYLQ